VVLDLTLKLWTLPKLLHGVVVVPLTDRESAHKAFETYQSLLRQYPDNLSIFVSLATVPGVGAAMILSTIWGPPGIQGVSQQVQQEDPGPADPLAALGESVLDQLTTLPNATVLMRQWAYYADTIDPNLNTLCPKGAYYHISTQIFSHFTPDVIDMLVDLIVDAPNPHSVVFIHDFHGPSTRIDPSDPSEGGAWALRTPHLMLEIIGIYNLDGKRTTTPSHVDRIHAWVRSAVHRLEKAAEGPIADGHINLLSSAERERVKAFFRETAERLNKIRAELDPERRFREQ